MGNEYTQSAGPAIARAGSLRDYIGIARPDHWFKNVFMLPGTLLAWLAIQPSDWVGAIGNVVLALVSTSLICSSNYTINETLDAEEDRQHPDKKYRPVASGRVNVALAYVQWLLLGIAGLGAAWMLSSAFFVIQCIFFGMGILYNVPPMRTKEVPYLDVLTESVNNPLRLLLGWYALGTTLIPPASLLLSYWMLGSYFMGIKRFAEIRHIDDTQVAASYRKSFKHYTSQRLLVSIMVYASACGLFGGVFLIRYRVEMILSIPLLAGFMGMYLKIGFLPNSPAQNPEKLYRHNGFLYYAILVAIGLVLCMIVRIPFLDRLFAPTIPGGF